MDHWIRSTVALPPGHALCYVASVKALLIACWPLGELCRIVAVVVDLNIPFD